MIRRAVSAVGRRLRRYVLPLVGQPTLRDMLERQQAALAVQGTMLKALQTRLHVSETYPRILNEAVALRHRVDSIEVNLCERLDALALCARDLPGLLSDEIDRLDAYLAYHADATQQAVTEVAGTVGTSSEMLQEVRAAVAAAREAIAGLPRILPANSGLDAIFASGSFDYVVPTREEGLLVYLTRHGVQGVEPGVRAVLAAEIRPGDVAVDAGASIGVHAVGMAAAVGPQGRLICFEPLPHLAATLPRTLRLNGFGDRSEVHAAALSDAPRAACLFAATHSPMSSLFPLPQGITGETIDVTVTTLDDTVPVGGRVDVIKIDVEGAEPQVWRGMRRVRADNLRLAIVLEWSASHFSRSGESALAFMREILEDGFAVSVIEDEPAGRRVPLAADQATEIEERNLVLLRGRS